MIPDRCADIQDGLSAYMDSTLGGHAMLGIAAHLEQCAVCSREFAAARSLQDALTSMRSLKAPADLGTKLRLAISHERRRTVSVYLERFAVRWDNVFRPLILQASAGFAGAVVLIGSIMLLLGMVAAPEPVMANDEPLGAVTTPHFLYSTTVPRPIMTPRDETIVVEASVNSLGKVYDFNLVSGPSNPEVRGQIVEQLLSSVFQPASVFGGPVRGRVVVTFSGVSVHA